LSSAHHLFRYLQPFNLIQSQVSEELKAAIADSDAVKPVDIMNEVFDLVDIVRNACKLKKVDYALRCANEFTLGGSKDDSNAFDVSVE
jgi:hypothetical protein